MTEDIVPTKKKLERKNVMRHQLNKWCNYLTSIRYMGTVPQHKICVVLENYAAYSGNWSLSVGCEKTILWPDENFLTKTDKLLH